VLPTFNPALLAPGERARHFAGRTHDLAELLRAVRENAARDHNQHLLVLGPRGLGKTALLLRAVDLVREDATLAGTWFPLVAPEELYEAGSLGEIWLALVQRLASTTGEARHQQACEALRQERDEARLAASALGHLLDFADRQQRRLLLVLENLQLLFGEQLDEKDAWGFREVLLHERRIMVLGSALSTFPGLRRPDAALYELFLLHPLEPLDLPGCLALWQAAGGPGLPAGRMRALRLLTGGNPRLLTSLAAQHPLRGLPQALAELLDEHTDSLKLTTETLPALERKIFVTLARLWEEAPAARVAEEARLDVNVVSAQLARLEGRGFVLSRRQGRGKAYQPADPCYSLYHLFRNPGKNGDRLRALLAFLDLFQGDEAPARGTLQEFRSLIAAQELGSRVLPLALGLTARGSGQVVLAVLEASPFAVRMEPLVLALRLYLGLEAKGVTLAQAIAEDLVLELHGLAKSAQEGPL
jgi:hypothetical protein